MSSMIKNYSGMILIVAAASALAFGQSVNPHHQMLGGPWELVVQFGMQGESLTFPIEVSDEKKVEKLQKILPLMGTPIKLQLQQYLPNLTWESYPVGKKPGGTVARLDIKGPQFQQELWLSSSDPSRTTITSPVGQVSIRQIYTPGKIAPIVKQLADPKAIGILTVKIDGKSPKLRDYVLRKGAKIALPVQKSTITILDFVPHYSVDTVTKKVANLSDKPLNPAIRVKIDRNGKVQEKWLWAKFPEFQHGSKGQSAEKEPFALIYRYIDYMTVDPSYELLCSPQGEASILYQADGKIITEKLRLNHPYPFKSKYSFAVKDILAHTVLERRWKNASDVLLHPAIQLQVEYSDKKEQLILELGKPKHFKIDNTTVVFYFKRQSKSKAVPVPQANQG